MASPVRPKLASTAPKFAAASKFSGSSFKARHIVGGELDGGPIVPKFAGFALGNRFPQKPQRLLHLPVAKALKTLLMFFPAQDRAHGT